MIASRFNLDQHIAELHQTRSTEFADQAGGRESASALSRIAAILRTRNASRATRRARAQLASS